MRLLYLWHADDGPCAADSRAGCQRRTNSRSHLGQPLSLHRLHPDRRGDPRRTRRLSPRPRVKNINAYVGQPVDRIEDQRFLRGRGQYVGDLPCDKALHAVVLRSAVAHGRIRSIDTSTARGMPGVRAILTAADLPSPIPIIPLRQEITPEMK